MSKLDALLSAAHRHYLMVLLKREAHREQRALDELSKGSRGEPRRKYERALRVEACRRLMELLDESPDAERLLALVTRSAVEVARNILDRSRSEDECNAIEDAVLLAKLVLAEAGEPA